MRLGKALATGVAEERSPLHDDVPEFIERPESSEVSQEAQGIREARGASEEAPAAR
ncbi:hypothetical protein AB0E08_20785 [Streptomyces sp. NPDC048281]|uniref:hypothetical protein n=1 Tax=Streptomyces sp. NPDC048281 TaxID=3154715 RepID=UPI0034356D41